MIDNEEIRLAKLCVEFAKEQGAQDCRLNLFKSESNLINTLNGAVDNVSHSLDRSMSLQLFVDGRFASFSTNRLEEQDLKDFIVKAISLTRVMEPDSARQLPEPERCCKCATNGREMGLYDDTFPLMDMDRRLEIALKNCLKAENTKDYSIVSEEAQYSDSEFDNISLDSRGLWCRHLETSFEYASNVTVQGPEGQKTSNYEWIARPMLKDLHTEEIAGKALEKAVAQLGAKAASSGRYNMVVHRDVASKLLTPLLNALGGYALQQNNSFLTDSLGKQLFSPALSVYEVCHRKGESGSRLFDSEGVATKEGPIIENGVIKQYFINTYIANKTGLEPSVEDAVRPLLKAWPEEGLDCRAIIGRCGSGILVTGFNGGNCNSATGDFSYGVEGFLFENGEIKAPVSEMLITGNMKELFCKLLYAGSDTRSDQSKLVPSLAFEGVDFSGL